MRKFKSKPAFDKNKYAQQLQRLNYLCEYDNTQSIPFHYLEKPVVNEIQQPPAQENIQTTTNSLDIYENKINSIFDNN